MLCTIYNGGRLESRYCFFAVKKDAESIHREDFNTHNKSDEYSTSVLGIQFSKDRRSTVQIISRYNHTVSNPNCTLGNNLDNLAEGLTQSFTNLLKERGLELTSTNIEDFEIPGYTLADDGRYYKYNMEINGNYYCPGNILISRGKVQSIGEPERGLLIDYFYIDFQTKTIGLLDKNLQDSFIDGLQNIEKIDVEKVEGGNKVIRVYLPNIEHPIIIKVDTDNQIIGYENHGIKRVGDYFLTANKRLKELSLPSLQQVGNDFLYANEKLRELSLPSLQQVGDNFLNDNEELSELSLPSLREIGGVFLSCNPELRKKVLLDLEKRKELITQIEEKMKKVEAQEQQINALKQERDTQIRETSQVKER